MLVLLVVLLVVLLLVLTLYRRHGGRTDLEVDAAAEAA